MTTQFTSTVKPSGGDYTSLNDAIVGLANDITAADIKVFSISAYSTPTISAGDTVLGQTSLATGVCVLVNAARTQILIKTIAVASFQSTEVVQKTLDANVNVTLSNAGDSPIIGIACYSMQDITEVDISTGWTTGANNYIYIYTPISERHHGKWDNTKYRLETTFSGIYIDTDYVRVEGLQIQITRDGDNGNAIYVESQNINNDIRISSSIFKAVIDGSYYHYGIFINNVNAIVRIWNNIFYDWISVTDPATYNYNIGIANSLCNTIYAYNNTAVNNYTGYSTDTGSFISINNISYNNLNNYDGTFNMTSNYNLSGPQQTNAPGVNSRNGPDMFVIFVNELGKDFHLTRNDMGARNYGVTDPGSGLFLDDIDGQTRPGQAIWDIGADEYFPIQSHGYITG